MPFVLDNSVAMRWILRDREPEAMRYASGVLRLLAEGDSVVVPAIWGLEAANVIARSQRKGLIKEADAAEFRTLVQQLDIEADSATHEQALSDTYHLALRYNLFAYDASYLELALRLGIPLATLDAGLLEAVAEAGGRTLQA